MYTLYVMVGPPGSGKSTYCKKQLDGIVVSSDAIREELFGDENNQSNGSLVFQIVKQRVIEAAKTNENVYLDCCNINRRKWIFKDLSGYFDKIVAVVLRTPKLDGTSCTFTLKKGKSGRLDYRVCSRNVSFDNPNKPCFYEKNYYIEMANKYNMREVLKYLLEKYNATFVTIQGECFGSKVQRRDYSMDYRELRVFNFIVDGVRYNSLEGKRILEEDIPYNKLPAAEGCEQNALMWVPILDENFQMPGTVEELLQYVERTNKSVIDNGDREGIVFRALNGNESFKAVDRNFIMKWHN